MSTTVNYKGNTIATLDNETKTLTTAGTWLEDDIEIVDETRTPKENDEVCFWDYEGTLVYSCSMAEAKTMAAMPDFPDHSNDIVPLTPLCWNWTLEQLHSIKYPADIGAIYTPTDEKSHFFIELDEKMGLTFSVGMYGGGTIDWGDGNTSIESATGTFSHTYSSYGKYHISVTNTLNGSSTSAIVFNPKEAVVDTIYLSNTIPHAWLGAWNGHLFENTRIEYAVIPYATSMTGYNHLGNAKKLKHLNLRYYYPAGINNLFVLEHITFPYVEGTQNAGDYFFYNCPSLKRLRLAGTFSSGRGLFSSLFSLQELTYDGYTSEGGALSSFNNLYALKSFTINSECTVISGTTFLTNAYSLENLYVNPTTPPTLSSASIHKHDFLRIHVPAESLTAYQGATNWSTYASYMVGDL